MPLKRHIPWQIKVIAKIILARLPMGYGSWKRLGLFRHGSMENPEYAFEIFCNHHRRIQAETLTKTGFVVLELGPGDSLFSALIAKAFGAAKTYLVDAGPFALEDLMLYRQMAEFLRGHGLPLEDFSDARKIGELLKTCSAEYLTEGLRSLRSIPSQSVDFLWSNSVLQHVRSHEFLSTLRELRRIQRSNGRGSHRVDLRDHLGGALNNLRFPSRVWESDFLATSGFYTNRIRYSEMLELFNQAGFRTEVLAARRWPKVPTPRHKLAASFRDLPEEELLISGFDVLLY